MILQAITDGGAISADWVLVGAFIVIGALLVIIFRIVASHVIDELKAINTRIDGHDTRLAKVETDTTLLKRDEGIIENIYRDLELIKQKV